MKCALLSILLSILASAVHSSPIDFNVYDINPARTTTLYTFDTDKVVILTENCLENGREIPGWTQQFGVGSFNIDSRYNDAASGIYLAPGVSITIYEDINQGGYHFEISNDSNENEYYCLADPNSNQRNNKLSSFTVTQKTRATQRGPDSSQFLFPGALLRQNCFDLSSHLGWSAYVSPGTYDSDSFSSLGIQDNDISGILLAPKTKILLYKDAHFANNGVNDVLELKNECGTTYKKYCLARDVDLQFNDAISSIKISTIS